MKTLISSVIVSIVIFLGFQMILPFPYGLVLGIIFAGMIFWYAKKRTSIGKNSLLNYRRVDPIDEKERSQNDEALRILEKKYIEEKISKEAYLKKKKEFEDTEYNVRKCNVCGSEEFEFVSEERIEEPGEYTSDIGYYNCKKCGAK